MLWWICAAVLAFFVKGICGFANTLVFTTVLSFGVSNVNISPVELLMGYPANAVMAWRERKSLRCRIWLPVSLLVLAGNIPGVLFLKNADTGVIKILFGLVIVLLGCEMLWRELFGVRQTVDGRGAKVFLTVIGVLSGILCGLYGVGALLGVYVSRAVKDNSGFRGNLCMIFFIENTFRILLYAVWGILTSDVLLQALLLIPFMAAGLAGGIICGRFIREQYMKRMVIVMLILSGAVLMMQNA